MRRKTAKRKLTAWQRYCYFGSWAGPAPKKRRVKSKEHPK